ncbi:serine/threonine-protein kinase [Haliangium sp.]|uniref:serine/threonine-protein kinase n=1 Tax=Haliangium sp. TaxID=2663208 RepID=UPI003D118E96
MYELVERIAFGGMAEIYLARELDCDSGEYLVVKRILPNFATDRELVEMFLDEQRVAATLEHENIVRTYDVGEVDGEYFISMEYLAGEDVRRISRLLQNRRERLPLALALSIVTQAAAGLHYAHEKRGMDLKPLGIVHRDVTPHNLVVTYDGLVKLVDFGVAKAANRQIDTKVGTIKGKVPYMSPEQCKGIELDRRCDIYALGIILYELTTGTRLYGPAGGDIAIMRRIVDEAVELPSARVPDYPAALERIVCKALEKEPDDRYQTADAFALEVEAFARSHGLTLGMDDLAEFMRAHFQSDFLAWEEAAGDITKLIDRIIAKHQEPDGDGEMVFRVDESSSSSLRRSREGTGSKHLGAALTESMDSVWGAAEGAKPTGGRASAGTGGRRADTAGDDAGAASASPPPRRAASEADGRTETGSGSGRPAMRSTGRRWANRPQLRGRPDRRRPDRDRGARRRVPWWWFALLLLGMGVAFWLGSLM